MNDCNLTSGHYSPVKVDYNNMKVLTAALMKYCDIDTETVNLNLSQMEDYFNYVAITIWDKHSRWVILMEMYYCHTGACDHNQTVSIQGSLF